MAISFNSDSLSTNLKKINPSAIEVKSPKIKTSDINTTITDAIPQIKEKVTNAVDNFKNIKTGALPEVQIPKIDPSTLTDKIEGINKESLASLSDIKSTLNAEQLKKQANIDAQLDNIEIEKISTEEVSKFQGDLFNDVKLNVDDITNTQLRDFNLDTTNQEKTINDITDNVVSNAKLTAEKGVSNFEKAKAQTKSVDTLDDLVDKKNIFI